ncbi:MAG: GGDEF domain-containing protein [Lachnospiraceae bacterium]|nr:GGDEF domain-containing protein [Lachnospiraceae bacterium]
MAVIYCYFLTLLSLLFAASLVRRSKYVNKYKNKYYMVAVGVNSAILLTEIGKEIGLLYGNRDLTVFSFVINYALAPFLPYCVMLMSRKHWKKREKLFMLPAVAIACIAISSPVTGLLFSVSEANEYSRGPFYLVSLLISLFYFIMMTIEASQEYRDADFSEKIYLFAIFAMSVTGVLVQVFVAGIASMWTTSAIALLLYYTFILELSSKYDVLTTVRNRMAYDNVKESMARQKNYGLVICDINGLKPVNDKYGHTQGDILIMKTAKLITKSFYNVGKVYRIGGDEFCVVCEDKDEQAILTALNQLEQNINKANKHNTNPVSVSYGMEIHKTEDTRSYQEIFDAADGRMYQMKQEFYQRNGNMRAGS